MHRISKENALGECLRLFGAELREERTKCFTTSRGDRARRRRAILRLEVVADGVRLRFVVLRDLRLEADLGAKVVERRPTGCTLTSAGEQLLPIAERVETSGVMVVGKPVARPLFDQALRLSMTARNRMLFLQNQNEKLQKKIEEMRMVDRAKCALIQYLRMTEQQAHRHIEKQAMDTRQTKMQVAKDIVNTYEML